MKQTKSLKLMTLFYYNDNKILPCPNTLFSKATVVFSSLSEI